MGIIIEYFGTFKMEQTKIGSGIMTWLVLVDLDILYHVSCMLYYVSCIMCHVSCIMCHVSCIMYHVSCIMYHVSCIKYHVSCIMYHVSCIMYHVSYIMYHVSCNFINVYNYYKYCKLDSVIGPNWSSRFTLVATLQVHMLSCEAFLYYGCKSDKLQILFRIWSSCLGLCSHHRGIICLTWCNL